MSLRALTRKLFGRSDAPSSAAGQPHPAPPSARPAAPFRPQLEVLEDRTVPSAVLATVSAGYVNDTPQLVITNVSSLPLTNVTLSGVGLSGAFVGLSGTQKLGNIAPHSSITIPFTASGGVFAADPDEVLDAGPGSDVQFSVHATLFGLPFVAPASFSTAQNSTGQFVDFLGVTNDDDFAPVQVASLKLL